MLNVAHDPAVNSPVYSHRAPPKADQGGSADDFGSLVDSNTTAADRDVPAPSPQDKPVRQADNNDRSARRDDRNDADNAADAQQAAPRTGVVTQKPKKSSGHAEAGTTKAGLTEGKSKLKAKDEPTDGASVDPSQSQQAAGDVTNPNVVVTTSAAAAMTATKSDGASDTPAETATPATGISVAVAMASTQDAAAGTDAKAVALATQTAADPAAGQAFSEKSKTGQAQIAADGAASATAGGGADETALSTGIVVPQQVAAAGMSATSTGVVKTDAVDGVAKGKSAKAPATTTETDGTGVKPGGDIKPDPSKSDASSSAEVADNNGRAGVASAKTDAPSAVPSHERQGTDTQTLKPDVSFQAALDLQTPVSQQPQAQQQFTVTVAGPTASTQAASVPVPVNALAVDIATRAAAGNTSFQIRLDPAELGRIDVRLDVDKHGRVTSHLTVEQPATLDMLRKDAPQLQRALEDAGLKTGDGGLQFSLRDQSPQGGQGDGGQGRHSQRLVVSEEVSTTPQAVGASYGRSSGSSSGVDISI
ncbi:flagellar hook-length control protein FliK [Afipia felis]|uniref:Flagellar hook-length control protein FliK n=2 Tax=Afipia felis TaxID=1035 RepID=A0A380W589_AFIFE|nr:flagellar hook-length control protein FliK [Afipia felis]EKS31302.1 hypothetical protein HMPREF9697_03830 [Afipia felis ATCC 53690]SUU76044.1 Flagellar hook-length control protein FliK [Afipia felis]SUU84111.1 Flagellar hook-length control protein FliK [Afipia felis]